MKEVPGMWRQAASNAVRTGAVRAGRAIRGLWPDRNPLRRTIDRVEAVAVGVLAVLFLAGVPLAACTAGNLAASGARAAAARQATWRQVPAVLLAAAPARESGIYQATARASWTAPDGTPRTGPVPVLPGQGAGGTVLVWVDRTGRLTGPPLARGGGRTAAAAVLPPLITGALLVCAGLLVHAVLQRRRLAAWDADWRITGPRWTRKQ